MVCYQTTVNSSPLEAGFHLRLSNVRFRDNADARLMSAMGAKGDIGKKVRFHYIFAMNKFPKGHMANPDDDPRVNAPGENLAIEWEQEQNSDALWDLLEMAKTDSVTATQSLEKLIEQGSPLAAMYLGSIYCFGRYGIQEDTEAAKRWWRIGSSKGSIEASFCLARQLEIEGDFKNAEREYRKMADRLFSPALYVLGKWHYQGIWFEQSVSKSIAYFEKAEKLGHLRAKHWLAHIFAKEKLGLRYSVRGWIKRIAMMLPFASYSVGYPNSDRLRT